MKYASLFATCAVGLALCACGDDDGSSTYKGPPPSEVAQMPAPPTTATTPPPTTATTPPPTTAGDTIDAGPAAPVEMGVAALTTDAAASCRVVLGNSWKALQPALAMVGPEVAKSEEDYIGSRYFIKKCSRLTSAQLDCLSKSENPVVGIADCKINEGLKSNEKIRLPSFRRPAAPPEDLPEDQQAKLLKSVVGTWKNEFKSYNQVTTWKISKTGDVQQTVTRNRKSEDKALKIAFEREGQVRVQTPPSSSQWYSYLPVDRRTMFLCNNLAYGAHPVEDEANFVLSTTNEIIAYKGEVCKVLTDSGHFVDATCAWEQDKKRKKERSFSVSYQAPDRKSATELHYDLIAGHLVDRRQVDTSKFVKR